MGSAHDDGLWYAQLERERLSAALREPPQPTGDVGELTECERHDVEHMRFLAERASPDDPDCCFDYSLVANVVAIIDRINSRLERSSDPLAWLEDNCCDLRCISLSTGAGDADIGWEVIEHHMAPPKERTIGQGDTPLKAIAMARAILTGPGEEA